MEDEPVKIPNRISPWIHVYLDKPSENLAQKGCELIHFDRPATRRSKISVIRDNCLVSMQNSTTLPVACGQLAVQVTDTFRRCKSISLLNTFVPLDQRHLGSPYFCSDISHQARSPKNNSRRPFG